MGKEGLERLDKSPLIGQIRVENGRVILPQDRPLGRLEQDVVSRIARRKLVLHFGVEVVVNILCFPIAVRQVERVDQRAIDDNPLIAAERDGMFGDECPRNLPSARFEQRMKRRAHGGFMRHAEVFKFAERFVIRPNGLVRGFEIERWHVGIIFLPRR